MRIDVGGVVAEAVALWRRDAALLNAVAGVFFLLPSLAFRLFVPLPVPPAEQTQEAAMAALLQWMGANGYWLIGERLVETFGAAVVLTLLLDADRPRLGVALGRAASRFLPFALAWSGAMLLIVTGTMFFLLPGMYALGRTFLTGPVAIAEAERGAGGALVRGIELTRGLGWLLLVLAMGAAGGAYVAAVLGASFLQDLASGGLAAGLINLAVATAAAAASLMLVLFQYVAYRRLAGTARQGI